MFFRLENFHLNMSKLCYSSWGPTRCFSPSLAHSLPKYIQANCSFLWLFRNIDSKIVHILQHYTTIKKKTRFILSDFLANRLQNIFYCRLQCLLLHIFLWYLVRRVAWRWGWWLRKLEICMQMFHSHLFPLSSK